MKKVIGVAVFLMFCVTSYGAVFDCNSLLKNNLSINFFAQYLTSEEGFKVGYKHGYNGIGYQNAGGSEEYKTGYHAGYFEGIEGKKNYNDGYQIGYSDKMEGLEFSITQTSKEYIKGYKQGWNQASSLYAMEYQRGYKAGYDHSLKKSPLMDFERSGKLTGAFKKGYREGYSFGKS